MPRRPDYEIGDAPVLTITTKDIDGNLADPGGLLVRVQIAGGTTATYTYLTDSQLTRESLGVFKLALPVFTVSGSRQVKATASGAHAASEQSEFNVIPSNIV